MRGEDLRSFREAMRKTQPAFAAWLNDGMGRSYDRAKVSRWESGSERIPQAVVAFLRRNAVVPVAKTGPAYTVSLTNQKGGVGKTTSSVNIAALLAESGYTVLLIDCDPQANASACLGVDIYECQKNGANLYFVLHDENGGPARPAMSCVVATTYKGLSVIPSSILLASVESEIMNDMEGIYRLSERLEEVKRGFDFVVMDTPPNLGRLVGNALTASDALLIPCQPEMLSMMGIKALRDTINTIKKRPNPGLDVLGIVPTLYNARHSQDQESLHDIHATFGSAAPPPLGGLHVFPPIPAATAYKQSTVARTPLALADPNAAGIEVYQQITDVLIRKRNEMIEVRDVA